MKHPSSLAILVLAGQFTLLGLLPTSAATLLLHDDFSSNTRTGWWAHNPSGSGQSWSVIQNNTFTSGYALGNTAGGSPNTTMYRSFTPVTLGIGESITLTLELIKSAPAGSAGSGVLNLKLGHDGGTPLTADWFNGPGADPTTNDVNININLLSNLFPNNALHTFSLTYTRLANGNYQRTTSFDGATPINSAVNASENPSYLFNQINLVWPWGTGGFNAISSVEITTTATVVPEPSSLLLLLGAALGSTWMVRNRHRRP